MKRWNIIITKINKEKNIAKIFKDKKNFGRM